VSAANTLTVALVQMRCLTGAIECNLDVMDRAVQEAVGRGTDVICYARDNRIFIAVVTQAGRASDEDFPGGAYVFTPGGVCLAETPDWSEGILYADLAFAPRAGCS
jgi:predicted amidohydrolase